MKELAQYIPAITALVAVLALVTTLRNTKRTERKDTAQDAGQLARIETTLDGVRNGVDDIRIEMRAQQQQINGMSERVARVEESAKNAHRRIDELKGE